MRRSQERPAHVTPSPACNDVTRLPFRVRPEARQIWLQHTGGSVGSLLGTQPAPLPAVAAGSNGVSARNKLRTNRSQARQNGSGRQPMKALPMNGVTEEALSCSRSNSSVTSFPSSPCSPRRHIDLNQLGADVSSVESVRGVKVISPRRRQSPQDSDEGITSPRDRSEGNPSLGGADGLLSGSKGVSEADGVEGTSHAAVGDDWLPSAGERAARSQAEERTLKPCITNSGAPRLGNGVAGQVNGRSGELSARIGGAGMPGRGVAANGGVPLPGGGDADVPAPPPLWNSERERTVRLKAPSESSDSLSSSRREKIHDIVSNLRSTVPSDPVTAARDISEELRQWRHLSRDVTPGGSVTSQPVTSRFSDETTQTFREQALERARAPYRKSVPSIAGSRKFKSSESLRDGGSEAALGQRISSDRNTTRRILNKCKSQSVTRLPGAPPSGRNPDSSGRDPSKTISVNGRLNGGMEPGRVAIVSSRTAAGHTNPATEVEEASTARQKVDFVLRNRQLASTQPRRCRSEPRINGKPQPSALHPGAVPKYLLRRQEEWRRAEEERVRSAPDPACPPGHTRMPDAERVETLLVLRENQESLLDQLRSLPIAHTSHRLVSQRADLEQQLRKVEEGVRIFSRPKVFIKNDDQ